MKYEFSRKTKNIFFIIVMLIVIGIGFYLAGLGTEVLLKFIYHKEIDITPSPLQAIQYAIQFRYSGIFFIIEILLLILFWISRWKYSDKMGVMSKGRENEQKKFAYSKKGTYGTAQDMTEKEIENQFNTYSGFNSEGVKKGDIIFGYETGRKHRIVGFPKEDYKKNITYNRNIMAVGVPGTGKTRKFIINQIISAIQRGESIVVPDTKGEIYKWTKKYAEQNGYITKIFNLCEQEYSDGWDILGEVRNNPEMTDVLVDTIIENTGGWIDFWDKAEGNVLKAVILLKSVGKCDITNTKGSDNTFGDVYKFIAGISIEEFHAAFAYLQSQMPEHPAILPYLAAKRSDEKKNILGDVLHGLSSRLQLFQSEQLRRITGTKDIDFELAGKRPCIYYLRFSDQNKTYKFITSLFFTVMYNKLVSYADSQLSGKLPVPVNMLLDEFSNIGEIPDFNSKLSTVRSRGINTTIIIQNIPQIKTHYPDDIWEEIVEDCDIFICLGVGNGEQTATFISNLTGVGTIEADSNSITLTDGTIRSTSGAGKRNVYTPDEIRRMDPSHLLMIVRGKNCFELEKIDFTENPESKLFEDELVTEHKTKVEAYRADYDSWDILQYSSVKTDLSDDKKPEQAKPVKTVNDKDTKKNNKRKPTSMRGFLDR